MSPLPTPTCSGDAVAGGPAPCGGCVRLAAEMATLQAENARLRLRLERLQAPTTTASSSVTSPQRSPSLPIDPSVVSAFSREEMQRYSRQMLVKEFGAEAQRRLRAARVLVIGAGGLGSPVAMYLAAMGVGKLTVVDDDCVDSSNLHRQVLHDESQLHEKKALSAQKRLQLINPLVECEPITARFNTGNALELVARHDVVIDASDNVGTRYLANDACAVARKPLVSGSAIGMEGQVTVFTYQHSTGCYRCMYPTPPRSQPMSCAENGVIGVVPGVIGCLQAMEAVKLIANVGETLVGVQCLYDAYDGQFRRLKLPNTRRPGCPACGSTAVSAIESNCEKTQDLAVQLLSGSFSTGERSSSAQVDLSLFYEGGGSCGDYKMEAAAASSRLERCQRISAEEFAHIRTAKAAEASATDRNTYILLDVRTKQQFDMVHFREAVHVPFQRFTSQKPCAEALARLLEPVQPNDSERGERSKASRTTPKVFVICRRGIDSVAATEWLAQSGVEHVLNVDGGYTAYAERVDPVFPIY